MNNRGMRRKGNDQKPKDYKYCLRRLGDYLYKFKWLLLIALILTIGSNMFALVGPKLLGKAIDAMEKENELGELYVDFPEVYRIAIMMAIFYVLSGILSYILSRLMIRIGKKVVYKMREDAFTKLQKLPVSYFDTNTIGDIISKMSYDIDTINTSLSSDVITICTSIITVIVSLIMMITIKPILVLVFAITILLYKRLSMLIEHFTGDFVSDNDLEKDDLELLENNEVPSDESLEQKKI